MNRTLLEEGNKRCPVCDGQKERLSRHWSYCEWPEISEAGHDLLTGILLGGGSLLGNGDAKHLVVKTTNEALARWLFNELGWLAHSLRRKTEDGAREPIYIVRTHAHDELRRYRAAWYVDGRKQLRSDVDLSPRSAQVWYALAGGIEWSGDYDSQFRLTFSAEADERAAAIQSVLDRAGFESKRLDRRVVLYADEARRWLALTAPPVAGVEYKWQTDQPVYRALRTDPGDEMEYRTVLYKSALSIARKRTAGELTPERFEARVDGISAEDVSDWLAGGSWESALSVAGVNSGEQERETATQQPRIEDGPGAGEWAGEYSDEEIRSAMRQAAADVDGRLTQQRYEDWATDRDVPTHSTIWSRFGWGPLADELGIEVGEQGRGTESSTDTDD
ncbi:hypothetical protein [Haloarcula amylovorans]|uniref:hypothetical protein n=1 Tax=Haloarcula amylovorans TaxID=2562280 RepID=UPI0010769306|nr:hypothetical protein [Halomicroarcula amylolytica]